MDILFTKDVAVPSGKWFWKHSFHEYERQMTQYHHNMTLRESGFYIGDPYIYIMYSKKTLTNLANYNNLPSFFADFDYFHNISYANGHQFGKLFLPNFLQTLFAKLFYHQSFSLYSVIYCNHYSTKDGIKFVNTAHTKNS